MEENRIKKRELIAWGLVTVLLIVIIGLFGYRYMWQRAVQRGADIAIVQIITQLNQNGQVIINTPQKQLVLVPKQKEITNGKEQ